MAPCASSVCCPHRNKRTSPPPAKPTAKPDKLFLVPESLDEDVFYICHPVQVSVARRSHLLSGLYETKGVASLPGSISFVDFCTWKDADILETNCELSTLATIIRVGHVLGDENFHGWVDRLASTTRTIDWHSSHARDDLLNGILTLPSYPQECLFRKLCGPDVRQLAEVLKLLPAPLHPLLIASTITKGHLSIYPSDLSLASLRYVSPLHSNLSSLTIEPGLCCAIQGTLLANALLAHSNLTCLTLTPPNSSGGAAALAALAPALPSLASLHSLHLSDHFHLPPAVDALIRALRALPSLQSLTLLGPNTTNYQPGVSVAKQSARLLPLLLSAPPNLTHLTLRSTHLHCASATILPTVNEVTLIIDDNPLNDLLPVSTSAAAQLELPLLERATIQLHLAEQQSSPFNPVPLRSALSSASALLSSAPLFSLEVMCPSDSFSKQELPFYVDELQNAFLGIPWTAMRALDFKCAYGEMVLPAAASILSTRSAAAALTSLEMAPFDEDGEQWKPFLDVLQSCVALESLCVTVTAECEGQLWRALAPLSRLTSLALLSWEHQKPLKLHPKRLVGVLPEQLRQLQLEHYVSVGGSTAVKQDFWALCDALQACRELQELSVMFHAMDSQGWGEIRRKMPQVLPSMTALRCVTLLVHLADGVDPRPGCGWVEALVAGMVQLPALQKVELFPECDGVCCEGWDAVEQRIIAAAAAHGVLVAFRY